MINIFKNIKYILDKWKNQPKKRRRKVGSKKYKSKINRTPKKRGRKPKNKIITKCKSCFC